MSDEPITNTTEKVERDPWGEIAAMTVMGTSGAIERQEAIGQRELVEASQADEVRLPADCPREEFAALGIEFGEPVDGDPIFVRARLPEGWKIVPTDHSMWSHLLDAQGVQRGAIFYKAAFYDRKAHMHLVSEDKS